MSKEQQKWVLIALLVGAALFAYFQFLYSPISSKLKDAKNKLAVKEKELQEAINKAGEHKKLKEEAIEEEKKLNFTMKRLPKAEDQPGLIKEISKIANEKNVSVLSLEILKPVPGKSFYSEVPIKLNLIADYHNFGEFLTKLGYSVRLINAVDCQFTGTVNNPKGDVNVTAMLRAFISTEEKEGTSLTTKQQESSEQPIFPLFRYARYVVRDPFKALSAGEIKLITEEVGITDLRLSGIIVVGKSSVAIFEDSSRASYYLINGKFYNKDKKLVKNIEGKIQGSKVVLSQLDVISGAPKETSYELLQ